MYCFDITKECLANFTAIHFVYGFDIREIKSRYHLTILFILGLNSKGHSPLREKKKLREKKLLKLFANVIFFSLSNKVYKFGCKTS